MPCTSSHTASAKLCTNTWSKRALESASTPTSASKVTCPSPSTQAWSTTNLSAIRIAELTATTLSLTKSTLTRRKVAQKPKPKLASQTTRLTDPKWVSRCRKDLKVWIALQQKGLSTTLFWARTRKRWPSGSKTTWFTKSSKLGSFSGCGRYWTLWSVKSTCWSCVKCSAKSSTLIWTACGKN